MIPFTITDPSKRPLAAYLVRLATDGKAELYDPAAKTWAVLTTFGTTVLTVTQLGSSTLYVGLIDDAAVNLTFTNFILACPAGGGEPIGAPAFIDATAPEYTQNITINVGKPF